jgi:hypothetical protein
MLEHQRARSSMAFIARQRLRHTSANQWSEHGDLLLRQVRKQHVELMVTILSTPGARSMRAELLPFGRASSELGNACISRKIARELGAARRRPHRICPPGAGEVTGARRGALSHRGGGFGGKAACFMAVSLNDSVAESRRARVALGVGWMGVGLVASLA